MNIKGQGNEQNSKFSHKLKNSPKLSTHEIEKQKNTSEIFYLKNLGKNFLYEFLKFVCTQNLVEYFTDENLTHEFLDQKIFTVQNFLIYRIRCVKIF